MKRILQDVINRASNGIGCQGVLCFCHLRWNFVYQRPQHLLSRCGERVQVHLWEEPIFESRDKPALESSYGKDGVRVLTPMLPHGMYGTAVRNAQRDLLDRYLAEQNLENFVAWYYTPMALLFSDHLSPAVTVYDCMDELSAFQGAPPELIEQEQRLFARADVVFAGGASLYASKRNQHGNVHLFPSSIDREHFASARRFHGDPEDQSSIPHPRIGFYGVLDERLDRELVKQVAKARPDWHIILIGPVVKIQQDELPRAANIHYLGQKSYSDLPRYLSGWDVAMLPFARNASTRFISPTKTPEFLAAGKPAVSTPIRDVVLPYGELGLVEIAADAHSFVEAITKCLKADLEKHCTSADEFLADKSWDSTFDGMWKEVCRCLQHDSEGADLTNAEKRSGACV
jgi:glycosyltransferase involved in cell wall biosynthesis